MTLPILSKLRDGVKFDWETLADNDEDTEKYWYEWWEGRDMGVIARPEVISDDDPILQETASKDAVDLLTNAPYFNEQLAIIKRTAFTNGYNVDREAFRSELCSFVEKRRASQQQEPVVVFAGGGYGSGKTAILNYLDQQGCLPLPGSHIVGVDIFKLLVPEFSLIHAVGDGRASLTVQKECKGMAGRVFNSMVSSRKSFIWDSSLSDAGAVDRVRMVRDAGYRVELVGILTPLPVAIRQAMGRAQETRRFPHPIHLPGSHKGFRENLMALSVVVDRAVVFAKPTFGGDNPIVIAEKDGREKELAIHNSSEFNSLLNLPM